MSFLGGGDPHAHPSPARPVSATLVSASAPSAPSTSQSPTARADQMVADIVAAASRSRGTEGPSDKADTTDQKPTKRVLPAFLQGAGPVRDSAEAPRAAAVATHKRPSDNRSGEEGDLGKSKTLPHTSRTTKAAAQPIPPSLSASAHAATNNSSPISVRPSLPAAPTATSSPALALPCISPQLSQQPQLKRRKTALGAGPAKQAPSNSDLRGDVSFEEKMDDVVFLLSGFVNPERDQVPLLRWHCEREQKGAHLLKSLPLSFFLSFFLSFSLSLSFSFLLSLSLFLSLFLTLFLSLIFSLPSSPSLSFPLPLPLCPSLIPLLYRFHSIKSASAQGTSHGSTIYC